jgi:transposase
MEDELILRQQAVELHLKGVPISDIVQKLGRSRQWVHKWITRYHNQGGDDWYLSRSTSPKRARNRTPPKEEELVINVRKALAGRRYSQTVH